MEVVKQFETGEDCAVTQVMDMAEATQEAIDMAAYGHSPVLRHNGVITHRWNACWVPVH